MNFTGIFGGYVAEAVVSGMSWPLYFERSFLYVSFSDIIPATLKTRSVVIASMLIILSDVVLVKIIFFFYPQVTNAMGFASG